MTDLLHVPAGRHSPVPLGATEPPLVVDLDDTLLLTDTLIESLLQLARTAPLRLAAVPLWALGGRAGLKRRIAERVTLDAEHLPVNAPLLEWLAEERGRGRALHLYSAADQSIVDQVARRLALFDTARGSDGTTNLSGAGKLAAIRAEIGDRFCYAGDSRRDLPVWRGGRSAILVGDVDRLRRALGPGVEVARTFPVARLEPATWARAVRLHQWSKNVLLFVALLLGGDIVDDLPEVSLGFVVFGLLASATYLLNDLLDLPHDRRHPRKRFRPLASGALPLRGGIATTAILLASAAALLAALPLGFATVTLLYLALTLAYSFRLKRVLMLDVFVLAGLFTIRIAAGIALVDHPVSPWLLAFSMFFFLSLACVKRYTECRAHLLAGVAEIPGRAYRSEDMPWLMAMGGASGFASISTFFLFLAGSGSPILEYPSPRWMWLICVILGYWLCRTWALAARGEMNDDPVLYALRDRLSLALAGATGVLVLLARA